MRIQKVSMRAGAIKTTCLKCGERIDGATEPMYADLDGEAFKAYYHMACIDVEQADESQE